MALIKHTPPPTQAKQDTPEQCTPLHLQSKVLEIKLLDYKGKEHKIQVSISNEVPILESWQPFTFIEMLNAEICATIKEHSNGEILGYQSSIWHEKGEVFIKSIEWKGRVIKNK